MLRPFISYNRTLVVGGEVATAIGTKNGHEINVVETSHRVSTGTGRSIARDTRITRLPLLCLSMYPYSMGRAEFTQ